MRIYENQHVVKFYAREIRSNHKVLERAARGKKCHKITNKYNLWLQMAAIRKKVPQVVHCLVIVSRCVPPL